MHKVFPIRLLLLFAAVGFFSLTAPRVAQGCEICKHYFFLGYVPCAPVKENEVGATACTDYYDLFAGFYCEESGNFCTSITVGGGGGGNGGGGSTGGTCQTSGYCPAECFSCSSGKPAV